jgi:hypothetical protein
MIRFFAIAFLSVTPALAQGVSGGRDAGGNIPRDKGSSASNIHQRAMVSGTVQSRPVIIKRVRRR